MQKLHIKCGGGYDVVIGSGLIDRADEYFNLARRVFIVTDSGVPSEYARAVAACCKSAKIYTVPEGEGSKSIRTFGEVLSAMAEFGLSRGDCAVAVGGGVVGDLTGFLAASYMRGIDFYNIPTTVLSQVDSSVGGKCAINLDGIKNIVGAFYQPRGVLIDTDTLKTLPKRQIASGLCEAVKMSLTNNAELFAYFEKNEIDENNIEFVIAEALKIKASVVEADERESGLRKILNFGHTVGHGIESTSELYHGEAVALGMLPMCSETLRPRVVEVLKKSNLYRKLQYDWDRITQAAFHDKKADGGSVTVTLVNEPGTFELKTMGCLDVIDMAKACLEG